MRVTEKLLLDNNRKKNHSNGESSLEETMTYDTRKKKREINAFENNCFSGVMKEGINTRKSVFDRKAVFHTNKDKMG